MKKLFLVTEINGSTQRFAREEDIEKGCCFIDGVDFFNCSDEELRRIEENEISVNDDDFNGTGVSYSDFVSLEDIKENKDRYKYVNAFDEVCETKDFDVDVEAYLNYYSDCTPKKVQTEDSFEEVEVVGTSNWCWNKEKNAFILKVEYTNSIIKKDEDEFFVVCNLSSNDKFGEDFRELKTYTKEEVEKIANVSLDENGHLIG